LAARELTICPLSPSAGNLKCHLTRHGEKTERSHLCANFCNTTSSPDDVDITDHGVCGSGYGSVVKGECGSTGVEGVREGYQGLKAGRGVHDGAREHGMN